MKLQPIRNLTSTFIFPGNTMSPYQVPYKHLKQNHPECCFGLLAEQELNTKGRSTLCPALNCFTCSLSLSHLG